MKKYLSRFLPVAMLAALVFLVLGACTKDESKQDQPFFKHQQKTSFQHIHGIGFAGENELLLATHKGILRYSGNKWYTTSKNKHDYMGFQTIKNGFYASGHPEKGSRWKDPLGLVKSSDYGRTVSKLSFYGETDFHALAAGYESGILYALNQQKNAKIGAGIYYTKDEGGTWAKSRLKGMTSKQLGGMAAHPLDERLFALYGKEGIFLSSNYGNDFVLFPTPDPVTSMSYGKNDILFATANENEILLYRLDYKTKKLSAMSSIEGTSEHPVLYLAENPEDGKQLALSTSSNNVYISNDKGGSWKEIAIEGKTE
ncbi:F510_1955 family glycosylhydrolase [Peribacillus sp. B-H-3]|uniref:F510_1955 family glycosylhydrolase n=1 Tax=Peribacillus sp. B-H-3 TaxID=3400420 RepID=UPI003B01D48C